MMTKTIKVDEKTHKRLQDAGSKGETFQDIINKILDKSERTDGLEYEIGLLEDIDEVEKEIENGEAIEFNSIKELKEAYS
ncbi:MAG: hypothetical protein Q4Q23_05560 [Methanobacteriaceae archaeon]|nr:hypothetical protein [Methanobacteriaceae archaeon]